MTETYFQSVARSTQKFDMVFDRHQRPKAQSFLEKCSRFHSMLVMVFILNASNICSTVLQFFTQLHESFSYYSTASVLYGNNISHQYQFTCYYGIFIFQPRDVLVQIYFGLAAYKEVFCKLAQNKKVSIMIINMIMIGQMFVFFACVLIIAINKCKQILFSRSRECFSSLSEQT